MIKKLFILSLCTLSLLLSACTTPTKTAENTPPEESVEIQPEISEIVVTSEQEPEKQPEKIKVEHIIVESENQEIPFNISFDIPAGWFYKILEGAKEDNTFAVYVMPEDGKNTNEHYENYIYIEYCKSLGFCGTGLEQKEIEFNGIKARQGFYDGATVWDFIALTEDYEGCYVFNQAKSLEQEYEAELNTVLYSITFEPRNN